MEENSITSGLALCYLLMLRDEVITVMIATSIQRLLKPNGEAILHAGPSTYYSLIVLGAFYT